MADDMGDMANAAVRQATVNRIFISQECNTLIRPRATLLGVGSRSAVELGNMLPVPLQETGIGLRVGVVDDADNLVAGNGEH